MGWVNGKCSPCDDEHCDLIGNVQQFAICVNTPDGAFGFRVLSFLTSRMFLLYVSPDDVDRRCTLLYRGHRELPLRFLCSFVPSFPGVHYIIFAVLERELVHSEQHSAENTKRHHTMKDETLSMTEHRKLYCTVRKLRYTTSGMNRPKNKLYTPKFYLALAIDSLRSSTTDS